MRFGDVEFGIIVVGTGGVIGEGEVAGIMITEVLHHFMTERQQDAEAWRCTIPNAEVWRCLIRKNTRERWSSSRNYDNGGTTSFWI